MDNATTKLKTYWSRSLNRAVTIPVDDDRPRIDALLEATQDLLAAIELSGVAPADPAAGEAWQTLVQKARDATRTFHAPAAR